MLFKELGLTAQTDATGSDLFGFSVSLNEIGDLFAVGAPAHQSNVGAVYLFRRNHDGSRTQIQKITPSDSPAGGKFGSSVAISAGVLAVGSPNVTGVSGRTDHGAVYLYFWDGSSFSSEQKIIPTGGQTPSSGSLNNTYFGHSVSLSTDGNYLAVGNNASNEEGCLVYAYQKTGASFALASVLSNPRSGAYVSKFGKAVCLDERGTTLVCGAPMLASSDNLSVKMGGAFTYVRRTASFNLMDSIYFPSTGIAFSEFGASVSVSQRGSIFTFGVPAYNNQQGAVALLLSSAPTFSMNLSQPVVFENHGFLIEPTVGTGSNLRFGSAHSLDKRGGRLLVGMDGSADTVGKTWVFEIFADLGYKNFSSGQAFEQVFEWNPPSITQSGQKYGQSVAMSSDGLVTLAGAPYHNSNGSVLSYKSRLNCSLVVQDIAHNFYSELEVDTGIDLSSYDTPFNAIPPVSKVAQKMVNTVTYTGRLDLILEKTGSPSGNLSFQFVFGDAVGPYSDPSAVIASSSNLAISSVSSLGTYSLDVPNKLIQENDQVWIVLEFDSTYLSSADASNYATLYGINGTFPEFRSYNGSWSTVPSFGLCYKPVSTYAVGRSEYGYLSVPPFDINNSLVTAKGAPYSVNGGEKIMLEKNGFLKQTLYLPTPAVAGQLTQAELISFLNANLDARFNCTAQAATVGGKDVVVIRNNDLFTNYYGAVEAQGFIRADTEWDLASNGTNPADDALAFTNGANIWLFKPDLMENFGITKTTVASDWHDWHETIHKPLQSFYFSNSDVGGPQVYFRPKVFIFPMGPLAVNWSLRELYAFVVNNFVLNPTQKKVLDMNGNYAPASLSALTDQTYINLVLLFQYDSANDQQYIGAYWYR
jgi:hypothetical protein